MTRHIIPYSQIQLVNNGAFDSLSEVAAWLRDLTEVHNKGGDAYYLHIDHMQIFPKNENDVYVVIAVYHRVYLTQG